MTLCIPVFTFLNSILRIGSILMRIRPDVGFILSRIGSKSYTLIQIVNIIFLSFIYEVNLSHQLKFILQPLMVYKLDLAKLEYFYNRFHSFIYLRSPKMGSKGIESSPKTLIFNPIFFFTTKSQTLDI